MIHTLAIETPLGIASIIADELGITEVSIRGNIKKKIPSNVPAILKTAASQLQEYFEGNRIIFDLQLKPAGTDFQKRVWQELATISHGKTASYLEIAKKLGDAKSVRAVATATSKNPLWVVIPCHRVIGSDGFLIGYAGGLWQKKWLLEHENPAKQQSLF